MTVEAAEVAGMIRVTLKPDQLKTVRHDLELTLSSYTEAIALHEKHGRPDAIATDTARRDAAEAVIRQCDHANPDVPVVLTWPIWLARSTMEMAASLALEELDSALADLEPGQTKALEQTRGALDEWLTILLLVHEFAVLLP